MAPVESLLDIWRWSDAVAIAAIPSKKFVATFLPAKPPTSVVGLPATSILHHVLGPLGVTHTTIITTKTCADQADATIVSSFHFITTFQRSQLTIRLGSRRGRYESDSDSDYSRSPPRRNRRKSLGEKALDAAGLGGVAAALTGRKDKDDHHDRHRSRSRRRRDSRSRSRSRSQDNKKKFQQAAKAAVTAAVIEGWRTRKEPGGIAGQGKRVMTAALGAAGINGAMDRDPEKHSTRHTIESALGGLASSRLINGQRESSRSRSRAKDGKEEGSGIGGVASAAGLAALAGKAFENYRSKSRDRGRARRDSYDSYDSRSPSPVGRKKRSKSVTERITAGFDKGMAKLGLGDSENHHPKYAKDKSGNRHISDDEPDYRSRPRGGGKDDDDSSTDSGFSSSEEERKAKKMRGKEYITAGLATVATIHAAHNIYQSAHAGRARHKKVLEGKMTPEEARRLKSKALLQDAASVGLATLGIKGAVSEWKEVNEKRRECHEAKENLQKRREHHQAKLRRRASSTGGRNSEPDYHRYQSDNDDYGYDPVPRYRDDNPYASGGLPPPPMGARY